MTDKEIVTEWVLRFGMQDVEYPELKSQMPHVSLFKISMLAENTTNSENTIYKLRPEILKIHGFEPYEQQEGAN